MAAISKRERAWALVRAQHGVISHRQLLGLGYTRSGIRHRVAKGRLFVVFKGVYSVGSPEVSQLGRWMAAVLACGRGAHLSHESAAQLLGFWPEHDGRVHVSLPSNSSPRPSGIKTHRREALTTRDLGTYKGIPVTSPACTIVDLASRYGARAMERAINEADAGDVITVPDLADELEAMPSGRRGAKVLRKLLQPATFSLTDSELERRFIPIARQAGLPRPQTQATVNGFRVDFYFEELGLIVETDGAKAHAAAGLTPLRFTHEQIAGTPGYVEETLRTVTARLIRVAARGPGASRPLPSPRVRAASA